MAVDVICLGEALMDLFAPVGLALKEARTFQMALGGAPANVSAALAKLGVRTGFIGAVGDDPFGHLLRDTLSETGVDISHLKLCQNANTTLAWVAQPDPNHSEFCFFRKPGADTQLTAADLDPDFIRQARIFHFGSVSLSVEPVRAATLHAARLAREAGVLVSYDLNWRPFLWSAPEEREAIIRQSFALADLVKVNETELALVTGAKELAAGTRWFLDHGARLVTVTCGERGAYFATQNAQGSEPSIPVEVIDATGCGDAFVGALLAALLELNRPVERLTESELRRTVTFANAAGALTATQRGGIPALPNRLQIDALLSQRAIPADAIPSTVAL